jgi:hypothetical protein
MCAFSLLPSLANCNLEQFAQIYYRFQHVNNSEYEKHVLRQNLIALLADGNIDPNDLNVDSQKEYVLCDLVQDYSNNRELVCVLLSIKDAKGNFFQLCDETVKKLQEQLQEKGSLCCRVVLADIKEMYLRQHFPDHSQSVRSQTW